MNNNPLLGHHCFLSSSQLLLHQIRLLGVIHISFVLKWVTKTLLTGSIYNLWLLIYHYYVYIFRFNAKLWNNVC